MIVSDASLAALLLTNRLVDTGTKPLSAAEYWSVVQLLGGLDGLDGVLGAAESELVSRLGGDAALASRIATLLGAASAFTFERERLEGEGVRVLPSTDPQFPATLISRLGSACPAYLTVAGPVEWLGGGGIGVVGSRDASPVALDVARAAAKVAVIAGLPIVSGLARGIDQASMAAALDAGGPVVGVPAEGLRVAARGPEVRRRVHAGELCIASPYAPSMRFTAGNAMGRNKIVYGLADVTLVVCSDNGSGGTWEGAKEALRRRFGTVAVWSGEGEGLGNAELIRLGGAAVTAVDDVMSVEAMPAPSDQSSLF